MEEWGRSQGGNRDLQSGAGVAGVHVLWALLFLVTSQTSCFPMKQLLKGTLLSCLADEITRKHSQKALMCNMGKNHVHHSIKFRLDLNGTLPLLTLGSTSPDKLICSGPCQMPSQPPPAHRENTVTLCLVPSDYILYLVPPHSSWPRPHKVMTHPPMFHFISSELQTLWH